MRKQKTTWDLFPPKMQKKIKGVNQNKLGFTFDRTKEKPEGLLDKFTSILDVKEQEKRVRLAEQTLKLVQGFERLSKDKKMLKHKKLIIP